MSSMLEQAIVDAAALREAALKNAEQSLIEKYAPQIKQAVEAMLESTDTPTPRQVKYEGRIAQVTTETDERGMIGISEGGKTYLVKESETQPLSEEDLLQEEEMDLGGTTDTPSTEAFDDVVPFAGNPKMQPDEFVNFSINVNALDGEIDIDLDQLESELAGDEMPEDDLGLDMMEPELETGEEELPGLEEEPPDEEEPLLESGGSDDDLQELLDLLSEYEGDILEEEAVADFHATKAGYITTDAGHQTYEQNLQLGSEAINEDEEEEDSEELKAKKVEETEGVLSDLYETTELLKSQNKQLETIVYKLNDKLEETLLSNAKLLYQNRTLCDASLNERQKEKIVEAIAKAESPKEAKRLQETLRTTVGSKQKKAPKSLSESVNKRGNLSGILNRRQNLNESQTDDPFMKKMQKLAGIKNNN